MDDNIMLYIKLFFFFFKSAFSYFHQIWYDNKEYELKSLLYKCHDITYTYNTGST